MLGTGILITIASTYISGMILSASYRMLRMSELKTMHDSTRVKDTKNDCVALARYHSQELKHVWAWPAALLDTKALTWLRELDKK